MQPLQQEPPKIYAAIVAVMRELKPISKDGQNEKQGFRYRKIDDVYNNLQPILAKHGIFTVPSVVKETRSERPSRNGGSMSFVILRIKYRFFAEDGSSVEAEVEGEGMDSGDKATSKAHSMAHKYALTQVFALPTDEPDPDGDSPDPGRRNSPPKGDRPPQGQQRAPQSTRTAPPPNRQAPPPGNRPPPSNRPAGNAPPEPSVARSEQPTDFNNTSPREFISEKQIAYIHALGKSLGYDHQQIHDECAVRFGVESMKLMSRKQAREFVDTLHGFVKARASKTSEERVTQHG